MAMETIILLCMSLGTRATCFHRVDSIYRYARCERFLYKNMFWDVMFNTRSTKYFKKRRYTSNIVELYQTSQTATKKGGHLKGGVLLCSLTQRIAGRLFEGHRVAPQLSSYIIRSTRYDHVVTASIYATLVWRAIGGNSTGIGLENIW